MSIRKTAVFTWIRLHPFRSALFAFVAVLLWQSLHSLPTNDIHNNIDHAFAKGQLFAYSLIDYGPATESRLVNGAIELAGKKLRDSPPTSLKDLSQGEIHEKRYLSLFSDLFEPVTIQMSPPESRLELVKLERKEIFYVMTFAAVTSSFSRSVVRADGKPQLVTVVLRYYEPISENPFIRWLKQVANVDFLPNAIRSVSSGDWFLVDYQYSYTLRDYYDWLRKNEQRLSEEYKQRSSADAIEAMDLSIEGITKRADEDLAMLYDWAYQQSRSQFSEMLKEMARQPE